MSAEENRWLPPSPHREEVLRRVAAGRAHIQERGHNVPPLLVFEDGGVIELPLVRYEVTRRGRELVSCASGAAEGQTKHNDVCGTIDEIKGILKEQPDLAREQPEVFSQLLDDAEYMLGRMRRRCEAYRNLADGLSEATAAMKAVTIPVVPKAIEKAARIRELLAGGATPPPGEEIEDLAEGVRDVANNLERTLRTFKEAAMEVACLLEGIRGGRVWKGPEDTSPAE